MFDHTREALESFVINGDLELLEVDSTSEIAVEVIKRFSSGHKKVFAILDSNHSHEHVFNELLVMDQSDLALRESTPILLRPQELWEEVFSQQ